GNNSFALMFCWDFIRGECLNVDGTQRMNLWDDEAFRSRAAHTGQGCDSKDFAFETTCLGDDLVSCASLGDAIVEHDHLFASYSRFEAHAFDAVVVALHFVSPDPNGLFACLKSQRNSRFQQNNVAGLRANEALSLVEEG